jgi:hypothetical protein
VEIGGRLFPQDPPRFYQTPFGYADSKAVEADAKAGGFTNVKCANVEFFQPVADWKIYATGLVRGNPMIAEIEAMDPVGPDTFRDALVETFRARFGESPSKMPLQAFVYECR